MGLSTAGFYDQGYYGSYRAQRCIAQTMCA